VELEKVISIAVAAGGSVGTGAYLGYWLVKAKVAHVSRVVDRVPELDWFKRVEAKLDRLQPEHVAKLEGFDPDRLQRHYTPVLELATTATECRLDVERLDDQVQDHESRIRVLEKR
jgi:hypothetical protein